MEKSGLLQRNDKFVTVHTKCSKIPPSASILQFQTRVWVSRVVNLSWSSRFLQPKCEPATPLVYPSIAPFFCKLRYSYNPTNKNMTFPTDLSQLTFQLKGKSCEAFGTIPSTKSALFKFRFEVLTSPPPFPQSADCSLHVTLPTNCPVSNYLIVSGPNSSYVVPRPNCRAKETKYCIFLQDRIYVTT